MSFGSKLLTNIRNLLITPNKEEKTFNWKKGILDGGPNHKQTKNIK
jgi:hypothetical protein